MIAFYPRLLQAFRQNGASLEGFAEHLELESKHSENKSGGIFKKVMEKIKKAFGLKKNKGQQSRLESA